MPTSWYEAEEKRKAEARRAAANTPETLHAARILPLRTRLANEQSRMNRAEHEQLSAERAIKDAIEARDRLVERDAYQPPGFPPVTPAERDASTKAVHDAELAVESRAS